MFPHGQSNSNLLLDKSDTFIETSKELSSVFHFVPVYSTLCKLLILVLVVVVIFSICLNFVFVLCIVTYCANHWWVWKKHVNWLMKVKKKQHNKNNKTNIYACQNLPTNPRVHVKSIFTWCHSSHLVCQINKRAAKLMYKKTILWKLNSFPI